MLLGAPVPIRQADPAARRVAIRDARSASLHRWAVATILAMFPLIWFGGLTTSHGAGMAVPDWPNTYGYNMFAVPLDVWLGESAGGIFFEHTHRLLGSLAGLFAMAATLWAWGAGTNARLRWWWSRSALVLIGVAAVSLVLMRLNVAGAHQLFGQFVGLCGGLALIGLLGLLARSREPRRWVRWLATGLLGAIILQGVLGGLRVTEVNIHLAVVHGVFAQLTLCLAGLLVIVTGSWWAKVAPVDPESAQAARKLLIAAAVLTVVIFGQLVVAAMMRHYQAGLAVPDFPMSYGQLVPPLSAEGLERANDQRVFERALEPTTLGQIWLHTAHRLGAVLVTLAVAWVIWCSRQTPARVRQGRLVGAIAGLLVLQICLGVATVWMKKPADVATAHVATGALLLLLSWVLTVRVARRYRPASIPAEASSPRQSAAKAAFGRALPV